MRTWRRASNLQVASMAEGVIVGKFDDFQFDLTDGTIYGYRLRATGVFSKTGGVAAVDLPVVGRDLVLVTRESAVDWAGLPRNNEEGRAWGTAYRGTRVMSRTGAGVGRVDDFLFDASPARVTGFLLDGDRLLAWDDRIRVGRDAVVIADPLVILGLESDEPETTDWWTRVRGAIRPDRRKGEDRRGEERRVDERRPEEKRDEEK